MAKKKKATPKVEKATPQPKDPRAARTKVRQNG